MRIDFAADSAELSRRVGATVIVSDDSTVLAGVIYPAIGVGVIRGASRSAKLFDGNRYSVEAAADWASGVLA